MKRDQLIDLVLARLGQRQRDTKLRDAAILEQQLIQSLNLERADFKPWFLLSEYEETIVKAGEYKISLPEHFLEEWEEGTLWYVPDPTQPQGRVAMRKMDYEDAIAYPSEDAPIYSIAGNYFLLPRPLLTDTTFQMRYYKGELLMTEPYGQDPQIVPGNKWTDLAADWYMGELGFLLSSNYTYDDAAAQKFAQSLGQAKHRIYVETIARQEANSSRTMGGDD